MQTINLYEAIDQLRQAIAERDSLQAENIRLHTLITKIQLAIGDTLVKAVGSPPVGGKWDFDADRRNNPDAGTPDNPVRPLLVSKGDRREVLPRSPANSIPQNKRILANNIDHLRDRMRQLLADGPINSSQGIKLMDNDRARCNLLRKELGILTTRLKRNLPGKQGKSCVWHYPHQHVDPDDDPKQYVRNDSPPLLLQGGTKGGLPNNEHTGQTTPAGKRDGTWDNPVPPLLIPKGNKGGDKPKTVLLGAARKPCKIYKRPKSEVDAAIQQARERGDVTEKHLLGDNHNTPPLAIAGRNEKGVS